jgi:hypothetical protein
MTPKRAYLVAAWVMASRLCLGGEVVGDQRQALGKRRPSASLQFRLQRCHNGVGHRDVALSGKFACQFMRADREFAGSW